jgi:hypothetical protein
LSQTQTSRTMPDAKIAKACLLILLFIQFPGVVA